MPTFDEELEAVLRDCNDRINMLEDSGCPDGEMLDALINRGRILSMMEYYTSALSDFNDAVDLIVEMECGKETVDPGSFVRVFVSRGELSADPGAMAEDYAMASSRLSEVTERTKFYDRKKIISMCMDCCEDLIDNGHAGGTPPFIDKLYEMLTGRDDDWSRNRYVELMNLSAQSLFDMGMEDDAYGYLSEAVAAGHDLLQKNSLEDTMSLVFALVLKGDIEQRKGLLEEYFIDRNAAISFLEELLSMNKLDDISVLVRMHQDIADSYMKVQKVKEAEEHLMREVVLNIDGAEEYIREYVNRGTR